MWVWIGLAHACMVLTDLAGARTLMQEIDEVLRLWPGLGTLAEQADELRAQLSRPRGPYSPGASALTAAELRLLPMLATYLSLREIAGQLSLSRVTVKAQAASIYRKLEASTRSQAVTRAHSLYPKFWGCHGRLSNRTLGACPGVTVLPSPTTVP